VRMMNSLRQMARTWVVAVAVIAVPALAFAQASITGTVRDASGAVLPGVTVEASSPALIEQVRSAVTDGTGQYRVVDLRPGTYVVTFTLPGFSTVRRAGIELTGSFTATVNADMRVGGVEETITVTGEAPTVDLQSTTRQRVLDREVVDSVPSGRSQFNLAALIPGVSLSANAVSGTSNQDVGGAVGNEQVTMTVHGSRGEDQRVTQNGISLGSASSGSMVGALVNPASFEEVTIDVSGASAEMAQGGLRINVIPREGGNTFRGTFFGSYANDALQGNNFSDDLRARGLTSPNLLKRNFDVNPGFGGPIARDRLWFYTSVRYNVAENFAAGAFANANANDPNAWTYVADPDRPASNDGKWKDATGRFTWQVTPRNKFAMSIDQQDRCSCPFQASATTSPEAGSNTRFPLQRSLQFDWTTPLTNRLLFEVVGIHRIEGWGFYPVDGMNPAMISVREASTGLTYRARASYSNNQNESFYYRTALSYITGSHALKFGFNDGQGANTATTTTLAPVNYQFNNGVPNQVTVWATPFSVKSRMDHDLGLYAQDRWTMDRLTLNLGIRYDHFASGFPETQIGPSVLTPSRDLVFPERSNLSWHDVTPKLGASLDLFGTGRTALKATLNKYVASQALGGLATSPNPVSTLVNSTTRSWVDVDRDFVVDCDLTNPAANSGGDTCGALANSNFGQTLPGSTFDRGILSGWGSRGSNWEFSAGVQHELMPRVSVDVGYFRRWYNNFLATDNLSVAAADYDTFSITAPTHASLSNGGGYPVTGVKTLKPASFGRPARNFVTFANDYGALERRRCDDQRAARGRPVAAGRAEHGADEHGQLRGGGGVARNAPQCLHPDPDQQRRVAAGAVLRAAVAIPDAGQAPWVLRGAADRCPRQRDVAERAWAAACFQLQRFECRGSRGPRKRDCGRQCEQHDPAQHPRTGSGVR
jgi:hypothetical protein